MRANGSICVLNSEGDNKSEGCKVAHANTTVWQPPDRAAFLSAYLLGTVSQYGIHA